MHCRVIGSGPVGLAFALFAWRAGLPRDRLQLDRPRLEALALGTADGPRRHLALSEGSRQLLSRVVPFPTAARIASIEVAIAGRAGRTHIRAADFGLPVLGHVLAWHELARTLAHAALAVVGPTPALASDDDHGRIDVHAEGVIDEPAADRLAFGQSALLADLRIAQRRTPPATAYEFFDRHGPLALLPIGTDDDHLSMVWCDVDTRSRDRLQRGAAHVERELSERVGDRLGPLVVDGPMTIAPLTRIRREPAPRRARGSGGGAPEVWIGNAAQTLHPVAGQGLNLGLRDAFELARLLGDVEERDFANRRATRNGAASPAAWRERMQSTLAAFERRRHLDRRVLVGITDALALGFDVPALHGLQSALLTALDVAPPLRRPLAATLLFGRRR